MFDELEQFRREANIRLAVWRWLFLLLAICLLVVLIWLKNAGSIDLIIPDGLLMIAFLVFGVLNFFIFLIARWVSDAKSRPLTTLMSFLTVLIDLALASLVFYLTAGSTIAWLIFLLPILSAALLFDLAGPFYTAFFSTAIPTTILYLIDQEQINWPVISQVADLQVKNFWLAESLAFGLAYFLIGGLFVYHLKYLQPLAFFTKRRADNKKKTKTSEEQVRWVSKISQQVDEANRALYAKDLELKIAQKQLATLEQAKSKFISVTTHQLRTPLSAIKWTFNMMLSGQLGQIDEEQKKFLQKGYESIQRMITIVNNLLNVDNIDALRSDYSFTTVQIEDMIESISFEFTAQLESKEIQFRIIKPNNPLPPISVDPTKIRMVIENLLDNAIKYTPKKGSVVVTIKDDRLNSVNPNVEIEVKDSGIGIPQEEQDKIFHKFFRATNAVSLEPDGSGIGLYISKDIVKKHNGSIWFESIPSKGTSFHFTLPLSQPERDVVE